MPGLRDRFGAGQGLRARFSAAVPIEDQWIEVGIFLVNPRTGERRLNNRNGGLPTLDTPTMAPPQPHQPSLLQIPEPVEQPRPAHTNEDKFQAWYHGYSEPMGLDPNPDDPRHHYNYQAAFDAGVSPGFDPTSGETHWPSQFKTDDHPNRFVGIIDTKYGIPRNIPGGLPTNAPMEGDDGLGPVDVSAPLGSWNPMMGPPEGGIRSPIGERLSADIASNAFGPFIGGAEMLGGWAEKTGLDALFPGAETPYGMREALRQRADELREQELLANPEGGFGRAASMTAREITTSLPGPSLLLGPAAGKAGGLIARTAGLGPTGQVLAAVGAGATEQGLENLADTVDRPWQERAAAVALGAGLGLAGGIGDIRRVSAGSAPVAGAGLGDAPPVGLRERFSLLRERFAPEAKLIPAEVPEVHPYAAVNEDGTPRFGMAEALREGGGFPADFYPWLDRQGLSDVHPQELVDLYGRFVAEENAALDARHATPPEPPPQPPELTPERWEELKAMNAARAAESAPARLLIDIEPETPWHQKPQPVAMNTARKAEPAISQAPEWWPKAIEERLADAGIEPAKVTRKVPRWAASHEDVDARYRAFLSRHRGEEISPDDLPFELADLPITRWDRTAGNRRSGRVGSMWTIGDSTQYRRTGQPTGDRPGVKVGDEGGNLLRTATFTPRKPLVVVPDYKGASNFYEWEETLARSASEAGYDSVIIASASRPEIMVLPGAEMQPRKSPAIDFALASEPPERLPDAMEFFADRPAPITDRAIPRIKEALRGRGQRLEPGGALPFGSASPSPLTTGLWKRFEARRPTAPTAPFEQRLAAAAYDRGLIRTPEDLSGLLTEAPRFAPAEPGRVAADAAIRDALEELRTRRTQPSAAGDVIAREPDGQTKQPPIVEFRRQAQRIESNLPMPEEGMVRLWRGNRPGEVGRNPSFTNDLPGIALPFREAYGGDISYVDIPAARLADFESHGAVATGAEFFLPADLAATARSVPFEPPKPGVFKPSEAGFIRLRPEPPPPDTPEGAAMEAFIGDPHEPPMTVAERFAAMRRGVESFYTEMVNLDAPIERLGKREGAPADMKRTIELQIQKTRGAADIAKNMAESRNDVESLWSIWNGADESTYRDWRRIGAAEREMELIDRAAAGDEIEIDQAAADIARNYLDTVVPQLRAQNPRLDRLLTETRRWGRDNVIEPFVDAGILSRESADEIYAKNQAHLPFNRVQRAVEAMAAGAQDEVARAKIHRITAGLSEVDKIREPMESLLQRAHHARVIAEQQKTRNLLADFVEQAPDVFPEIKPVETKALPVAMVDDKTIFRRKPTKTRKTEAFPVWRDGEMQLWEGPEDVMNVVNFLGPHELQAGLKAVHSALSVAGKALRAGVTSTLEFALYRNPGFDQLEAFINSKAGFVPIVDTLRGLFHVAGKSQYWDEAMRAGAGNSVLVAMDRPDAVARISSVMQERGMAGSIKAALDAWKDAAFPATGKILGIPGEVLGRAPGKRGFAPLRGALMPLQAISQVMEAPTRMGGYLAAEHPMPWNKAVRAAENLVVPQSQRVGMGPLGTELGMEEFRSNTLDFLRGGRLGKLLNGPEAFLNPEIQGWDKFARNLKYRPGPTLLKALAAFTFPALVHWEMNHDSEEYRREPEWKKMLFYRVPLPNGTSIPVPRGRGLASLVFGYMTEKVLDHMAETDPDAARDVVAALVQNTPAHYAIDVRPNSVMPSMDVIPTALEPEIEVATNWDAFRRAPVEPRGKTSLLPEDRFSATTSPTLQALSDATPFSPLQLQHLVRGHFGGVGQYATGIADQFMDSEFQELPPDNELPPPLDWVPTDAPLIKGLVSREPVGFSSKPVQDFYAELERATQARNSYKEATESGRIERATEIEQEHPEFNFAQDLERAAEKLGKIRKDWNEIRALPEGAATPEEIRQWLHDLDVEATLVAEDALRGIGLMK